MADRHIDTLPEVPATPAVQAATNQPPAPAVPLSRPDAAVMPEAPPRDATAGSTAPTIADRASYAAHYVQEHYVREMVTGLERIIRRYPAPSLVGAAVAGFIVGRALRSR
jgi:hypothetical protein